MLDIDNTKNIKLQEKNINAPLSNSKQSSIITFNDLMQMSFPDPQWIIPGIIPEGVTVIAGAPKAGKSWLALDICLALVSGGKVLGRQVKQMNPLYIALEDTLQRLQSRIVKQTSHETISVPNFECIFATRWEKGNEGFLNLYNFIKANNIHVVIIDTMVRFSSVQDANDYNQNSRFMADIKSLSEDLNISIILIHHTRKINNDNDFINNVLGSIGISGGADNIIVMSRPRNNTDGILKLTSRDTEEAEYMMSFDPDTCRWNITGSAAEITESNQRTEILEIMKRSGKEMSPKEVSDILGKKPNTVTYLMNKMVEAGNIIKTGYGKYSVKPLTPPQSPQSPQTE